MFADDTKILKQVDTTESSLSLQDDTSSLERWSKDWLLRFNLDKCHVLTLGKHQNVSHAHPYQLHTEELEHVFEEKDLPENPGMSWTVYGTFPQSGDHPPAGSI